LDKIRERGEDIHIYVKFTKKTNMNVFVYVGNSRTTATEPIIDDNERV